MPRTKKQSAEAAVREIRRRTRRKFAPEEKIRIVLEGLRGEQSAVEGVLQTGRTSPVRGPTSRWRENGSALPRVRYLAEDLSVCEPSDTSGPIGELI